MAFLKPDGTSFTFYTEKFLGDGTNGIVLHRGAHALKIPKVRDTSNLSGEERETEEYVNDANRDVLESEKAVYRRVGRCEGIAECLNLSEQGILLAYFKRGDLEAYVANEAEPDRACKARWISSVIKTVFHLHRSKVLIDDIALRNFLLDDDLSLKMIDFGQCSLFPLDTDITTASDNGMTAQVDIFHLGCIIYSIVVWKRFECNLFERDFQRPPLKDLPALDGLLCGEIIQKCWTGEFPSMKELCSEAQIVLGADVFGKAGLK